MYQYAATIERVVDADTLDVAIDLGFDVAIRQRLRLDGVDAPELRTAAGKVAREWVVELVKQAAGKCVAVTRKDRQEKYGRYLAAVTLAGNDKTLTELLLAAGHGTPYSGGKR